jgi:hypothetical protein
LRMKALIPELLGLLTATNFGGITLLWRVILFKFTLFFQGQLNPKTDQHKGIRVSFLFVYLFYFIFVHLHKFL